MILASASPRRKMLLESAGIEVCVDVPEIDESHGADESAGAYVERMACMKASEVARRHAGTLEAVVAADTIVVRDGEILGKPADSAQALGMLEGLNGRAHEVMTAVCVMIPGKGRETHFTVRTKVVFASISRERLVRYVESGEPMDKAGAYGIQGKAAGFVKKIDGSYTNVVGLPLCETLEALETLGK